MNYSDFAEKMLLGLYQDSRDFDDGGPIYAHQIANRYDLEPDPRWIGRLAQEWGVEGLANVHSVPNDSHPGRSFHQVEITGRGMRQVESTYGTKDGVGLVLPRQPVERPGRVYFTDEDGAYLTDEDGAYLYENVPSAAENGQQGEAVESSRWTGLPTDFELTELRRDALQKAIAIAEGHLDALGASNAEKAQARAYIVAIRALSEAPEPPADIIWSLLNRAATIATIASLFVPLIQVLVK